MTEPQSPLADLAYSIAHKLAYELLKAGAGRLQAAAFGDEEEQALHRAFDRAFVALLRAMDPDLDEETAIIPTTGTTTTDFASPAVAGGPAREKPVVRLFLTIGQRRPIPRGLHPQGESRSRPRSLPDQRVGTAKENRPRLSP